MSSHVPPHRVGVTELSDADFLTHADLLQQHLLDAQSRLEESEITGTAGGVVWVTLSALGEPRVVHIDPSAVDPDDIDGLEVLVLQALQHATEQVRRNSQNIMGPVSDFFQRLQ